MNDLEKYNEVRSEIKTGDIISWRSNHLVGQLIRVFSSGKVNHVSTVTKMDCLDLDRILITEALGSGLQPQRLSDRLSKHKGKAWWHHLKDKYNPIRGNIEKWLIERWWTPYGFGELFDFMDGKVKANSKRMICSESAFLAAKFAGVEEMQNTIYSPSPETLTWFFCYEKGIEIL